MHLGFTLVFSHRQPFPPLKLEVPMSTILNSISRTAALRHPASVPGQARLHTSPSSIGVRSLSVVLLAAGVSALVIFADKYVGVWTDDHLFLGWVMLWAVVFAGLALFAGTARHLAARAMGVLDGWSVAIARSRAEDRLWTIAKSDPRVMAELMTARMRERDAQQGGDFDAALAPMGLEPPLAAEGAKGWVHFAERLAASRAHRIHMHYI